MPQKKKPKSCPEGYHASLKVNLLHFLSLTDYVGIQETIPPDPPQALSNCRQCLTTIAFNLTASQIAQLQGEKLNRARRQNPIPAAACQLAIRLAGERQELKYSFNGRKSDMPKYSYREIARMLVEEKQVQTPPDPAIVRRIVIAAGVTR